MGSLVFECRAFLGRYFPSQDGTRCLWTIDCRLPGTAPTLNFSYNERCEVRHKFPTRAQFFPSGDKQLCWTHPGQLRRRVEAHHCEPTSTRWPPGYALPFSSFSLTQRVIMLRRAFTTIFARILELPLKEGFYDNALWRITSWYQWALSLGIRVCVR